MAQLNIEEVKRRYSIVGTSDKLDQAIGTALQVATTNLSVLVIGESGVGKEIIPRIIHDNSTRKGGPYLAINCGSIPEGTIESELFGHERGAFTGAIGEKEGYFGAANKGTLFLDEVGELPLPTQARLLRVLEAHEFIRVGGHKAIKTDVRVVAATNVNLEKAIKEGRFREDLYYRLNVVPIMMPALRERGQDIERLFRSFALSIAQQYNMPRIELTDEAKAILMKYKWPGNIRQLKNITERMSVLSTERVIDAKTIKVFIPDDPESREIAVIPGAADKGYADEREMLWTVIAEMKRNMDSMSAEIKKLTMQLGEQHGNINAHAFDTAQSEPLPYSIDMTNAHAPQAPEFQEVEEVIDNLQDALPHNLKEQNEQTLRKVLELHNGNRKETAKALGISDRTLYRRLKELGIT